MEVLLSLLLALSIGQAGLESANQAREAKNTTKVESVKVEKLVESKKVAQKEVEQVKATTNKSNDDYDWVYFELTAYSNHENSTGKNKGDADYGITASGEKTKEGVTIAADWRVLPKGTRVYIDGVGERVVQDKGGDIKNKRIDVYFESEKEALNFGRRKHVKVRIID
ncbi:3D domain-containing protein [Paenibacillus xylanexedens]|uniref:3D domain-containing protein n=1 Tax=Paenibacillus xylanexedens TaxID=528191 RepID=UPI0011A1B0DA|nr:3D domain-containing protein [Paenibacillus xylanexedens]